MLSKKSMLLRNVYMLKNVLRCFLKILTSFKKFMGFEIMLTVVGNMFKCWKKNVELPKMLTIFLQTLMVFRKYVLGGSKIRSWV
jgi:hypothetical protein